MPLNLTYNDACPMCGKPTMRSAIEPHPSRHDIALQDFYCGDCGPIKTIVLSLKPVKKQPPDLAA
jgi:hypothetical protein